MGQRFSPRAGLYDESEAPHRVHLSTAGKKVLARIVKWASEAQPSSKLEFAEFVQLGHKQELKNFKASFKF